ncbi:MAG: isoprenylcysteine carboxylmethyltransferase family protein [Anaerolineales bacterium]|nr:isoprenylcysteine carboxylmethyltransferase family protein [Anaerolineales bacterium]MCB8936935.1 isoprenylcysteine carboxylmethyltransferase family protein [Ardenticatenaceae bacterium]
MKLFLVVYLVLFYGLAMFWRTYVIWRATGINPYRLTHADGLAAFLGQLYRLVSVGIIGSVLIYSVAPAAWYAYLGPLHWLEGRVGTAVGIILLISSLGLVLLAQAQMGRSWRIGIDEENQTALVTHGIFRFSRNPIFLGMRLSMLGLFLVMPNALTLVLWLLGDVAIQAQVFLEEQHLGQQHGVNYEQYQATTPRYLGLPSR